MTALLMAFVVLFVAFTAVIVNVAKTFRIKNEVINIIEQSQYSGGYSSDVDTYLSNAGYQKVNDNSGTKANNCQSNGEYNDGYWGDQGYCIAPVHDSSQTDKVAYYKVTVYVSISLPFFDIEMTLPVSGETRSYPDLS